MSKIRPIDANRMLCGEKGEFEKNLDLCDGLDLNDWVNNQPTLDYDPIRHGHWIVEPIEQGCPFSHFRCSECGRISNQREPYCHCGAKME